MKTEINLNYQKFRRLFKTLYFILLASIVYVLYGHILYKMQDLSYFTSSFQELKEIVYLPYGYFSYLSRFFLQFAFYPIIGSLLLTFFLFVIQWLTQQIICYCSSIALYISSFIPSSLLFIILTWYRYSFYYQYFPEYVFNIPFICIGTLTIIWLLSTLFHYKRKNENIILTQKELLRNSLAGLLLLSFTYFCSYRDENLLALVKIQKYTNEQKWEKVIDCANKVKRPTRSIALYRAIALLNTNQLGEHLFDILYDFPSIPHTVGTEYKEYLIYVADGNFYSGLINPAYHESLQYMGKRGASPQLLRLLTKCSILNQEWNLAQKYISIWGKSFFQKEDAEKYANYIKHKELIAKDKELVSVFDLQPVQNNFEQSFRKPMFLGYYTVAASGKSKRSMEVSLAACLYAKEMDSFLSRISPLNGNKIIPKHFQEAIIMESITRTPNFDKSFSISPKIKNRTLELYKLGGDYYNTADKGKDALMNFKDNYLYYYNFGK